MFTFLDLLIVVVMALAAVSVLSIAGMFLVKNQKLKRICFYLTAAMGIYFGYVGVRILWPGFMPQVILALVLAAVSIGAIVLSRVKKDNDKMFRIAQVMSYVALVAGMFNAFL